MKSRSQIDHAYSQMEHSARSGWVISEVSWRGLENFNESLRSLENHLKLQQIDDSWGPFVRFCRTFRYLLIATPLPASQINQVIRGWSRFDGISLEQLKMNLDETAGRLFSQLIKAFAELQGEAENPMSRNAVADLRQTVSESSQIAVLSPDARLSMPIKKHFAKCLAHENLICLRPSELKSLTIFDALLVFGPTRRRFSDGSEFVYSAPRATALRLYTPSCFPASIPIPYRFAGSPHLMPGASSFADLRSFAAPSVTTAANIFEAAEIPDTKGEQTWLDALPQLDVPPGNYIDNSDSEEWDNEPVSAKQILLGADHAVFLAPESSIYRLNREKRGEAGEWVCTGVEHTDVRDIGSGDVLLFQSAGGGSMVSEIADQLLGENRQHHRDSQNLWKSKLRNYIIHFSNTSKVLKLLRDDGSNIRSEATVRNWCASWNIGPGSWRDFDRLLRILSLQEERERIFNATKALRIAHRQAGSALASRLLKMMKGQSLGELMRNGIQEFHGADGMSNRKVGYEVIAVLPEECEVLPNRLTQPFPLQ